MAKGAQASAHAERIRVEQIRLLLGNLGSSTIPGVLLALLMAWAMSNASNGAALRLWCAAIILSKLYDTWDARRLLAAPIFPGQARHIVWRLMLLHAIDGAAWGALAWVTLDTASVPGSILVVAVMCGVVGNSMSILSPVLPAFVMFCLFELGALALTVWQLHDRAYDALGVAALLYIASLLGQARNSNRATRAAIELRFENTDLIALLRAETTKAQTAYREAEQANQAKSKFLAAASHDLRQPIHAQGLFLEVLARSELRQHQRELVASARSASEASAGMLDTLLDFSRIEAGVVEPQIAAFHLQPLLNKLENELGPLANAKGLLYRTRETHAAVVSDPALVELVLRNLISNAIRYTEHGGVLIGCRASGGSVRLEVWDSGIGIPPAQQQEVFREFHQLGNPERDRQKGLGLGLAIAQGVTRILGHELTLASRPGRGSVFSLRMPRTARTVVADDALAPDLPRMLQGRVLLIDDDAFVRAAMHHLLQDWGCQCDVAESIVDALALARANPPDLVISDFRLREQHTGAQAIDALRQQLGFQLPALLITGDTAPLRLREARAAGVPLMHKPVSPARLHQTLAELLVAP